MSDIERSVDLDKVVRRLSLQLAELHREKAMLEVAYTDVLEQAQQLHTENLELKQAAASKQSKDSAK